MPKWKPNKTFKIKNAKFSRRIWPFYQLYHPAPRFAVFRDDKTRESFEFRAPIVVMLCWQRRVAHRTVFLHNIKSRPFLREVVIQSNVLKQSFRRFAFKNAMITRLWIPRWLFHDGFPRKERVSFCIRCNVRHLISFSIFRVSEIYISWQ